MILIGEDALDFCMELMHDGLPDEKACPAECNAPKTDVDKRLHALHCQMMMHSNMKQQEAEMYARNFGTRLNFVDPRLLEPTPPRVREMESAVDAIQSSTMQMKEIAAKNKALLNGLHQMITNHPCVSDFFTEINLEMHK